MFGREAKPEDDRARELVQSALAALDLVFAKMTGLRDDGQEVVHVEDLTQLLASAHLVGGAPHLSDVASEVRVANHQRVQGLPEDSRTKAAKSVTVRVRKPSALQSCRGSTHPSSSSFPSLLSPSYA